MHDVCLLSQWHASLPRLLSTFFWFGLSCPISAPQCCYQWPKSRVVRPRLVVLPLFYLERMPIWQLL